MTTTAGVSRHAQCWARIQELNARLEMMEKRLVVEQRRVRAAQAKAVEWEERFLGKPRRDGGTLRQRGLCRMCGVPWDEKTTGCDGCRSRHMQRRLKEART